MYDLRICCVVLCRPLRGLIRGVMPFPTAGAVGYYVSPSSRVSVSDGSEIIVRQCRGGSCTRPEKDDVRVRNRTKENPRSG